MHVKDWRACESKVADTVDRGEIASLLFGFNHHILGCRAKCQMLFVQVVKAQKEVHGDSGTKLHSSKLRTGETATRCHYEGQTRGGKVIIHSVKYLGFVTRAVGETHKESATSCHSSYLEETENTTMAYINVCIDTFVFLLSGAQTYSIHSLEDVYQIRHVCQIANK